ncbi:MAG: pyridoxal phosphate-dependent aminotransferase [Anaeroplasmataceae bacterium]
MINQKYKDMTNKKSQIREMYMYGLQRKKIVGEENVFDYSLGNPSVRAPKSFDDAIFDIMENRDSIEVNGYSPNLGNDEMREAVANSLNRRFNMNYTKNEIFPTSGAAGAIAHAIRAVTEPGDEVITFAPYFPEYNHYVGGAGAILKVVSADIKTFQINFEEFVNMLNPKVMAVLINTPNNPSGIVYSTDTIKKLAAILKEKEQEYGHDIYIISDEPYREIVFKGVDNPFISSFYDNTIMCYSYSKSLSLPGERIGYVAVNPACKDSKLIIEICGQISRGIGHNCPTSLIQMAVAQCVDDTSDLSVYETNMNILYDKLTSLGFEVVKPGGTFYMFPKCLEPDSQRFCENAKKLDLLLVPSDTFGVPGHFRIAYCVTTDFVKRSLPKFEALKKMYDQK